MSILYGRSHGLVGVTMYMNREGVEFSPRSLDSVVGVRQPIRARDECSRAVEH